MVATEIKIENQRSFIDESFQTDRPEMYNLFIYAGPNEFSCVIAERATKKFIALESYKTSGSLTSFSELLEKLIEQSSILKSVNYRRVIIGSGFNVSTLVPNPLYDPSAATSQLNFSNNVHTSDEIMTDELRQVEARNVFAVPSELYAEIVRRFPSAEFHHSSTAMIEFLLSINRNSENELMTINVHSSLIEIIVTKGKNILLYNSYHFESPEELVYYILFVCEQLHLNPENIDLQFAGLMRTTDSAYMLCRKYIRNTRLAERPENYSYSFGFDTFPSNFHFNLFCQLVCAS